MPNDSRINVKQKKIWTFVRRIAQISVGVVADINIYDNATQIAGSTPMLRLHKLEQAYGSKARIFAKLEGFNPSGSVKDRGVLFMLQNALENGDLTAGGTVISASSGNSAISLCQMAAALSLKSVIVTPDSASKQFQDVLKLFGASVVLTAAKDAMEGAHLKAGVICLQTENSFVIDQFENDNACEAHRQTTGPEIWEALGEVDYFVAGVGTGATITGCGEFLKSRSIDCRVVAVEPMDSPVLSGGFASSHTIYGIGAGFVPEILNEGIIDEIIRVRTPDAIELRSSCARMEGVGCGMSAGAALAAAVSIGAREEAQGKTIVVILPDNGVQNIF